MIRKSSQGFYRYGGEQYMPEAVRYLAGVVMVNNLITIKPTIKTPELEFGVFSHG
jgi:hypothetical protein